MPTIENVLRVKQGNNAFYLAVVPISILKNHAKIDYYDPETNMGYQRKPSQTRVRAAMSYITQKRDSSFPLTIVANIRNKDEITYDEQGKVLHIPDDVPLWIIDGQHRFEALKLAEEEGYDVDGFEVPVSIYTYDDWLREALEFLTINKTQKSVRTDLAERIISMALENTTMKEKILAEAAGPMSRVFKDSSDIHLLTKITDNLNLDPSSFWFERIRLPNAPKGKTTVTQRSFTESLKAFTKTPAFRDLNVDIITKALMNFWDVISELCPYSSDPESKSVLLKTMGVYVMHQVFSEIIGLIRLRNGRYVLTKDEFRKYLTAAEKYVNDDFWGPNGGVSLYGTSAKSFAYVTRLIMDTIKEQFPDSDDFYKENVEI